MNLTQTKLLLTAFEAYREKGSSYVEVLMRNNDMLLEYSEAAESLVAEKLIIPHSDNLNPVFTQRNRVTYNLPQDLLLCYELSNQGLALTRQILEEKQS